LTERIYHSLRDAILENGLRPGALVSERDLARELRVSKTPVREALIRLAQEGFVEISPRKGIFVSPISVKELRDVFGIRSALEGLAAEEAAARIGREELAKLRRDLGAAAKAKDRERLFRLGAELHDLIMEACDNKRLSSIVGTMRAQIARYSNLASRLPEQAEESLRDHLRMIRALERRDGTAARRAVERHISGVKENLIRSML
jgi:DNA-binding GntR family transcriptional regulator